MLLSILGNRSLTRNVLGIEEVGGRCIRMSRKSIGCKFAIEPITKYHVDDSCWCIEKKMLEFRALSSFDSYSSLTCVVFLVDVLLIRVFIALMSLDV